MKILHGALVLAVGALIAASSPAIASYQPQVLPVSAGGTGQSTQISSRCYLATADQSIPGATYTKMAFNAIDWDNGSNISAGTFTVPSSGKYLVDIQATWAGGNPANNLTGIVIYVNNVLVRSLGWNITPISAAVLQSSSAVINAVVADKIEAWCYSGAALPLSSGTGSRNYMEVTRIQ